MTTPRAERVDQPQWLAKGDLVEWADVEQRLADTRHYWVASIRPDGRPHTRPVWGIWFRERLVLSGGGGYWMMRNVAATPEVSVHPENAEGLVVVVDGTAHDAAEASWKAEATEQYDAKYSISYAEMWHYGTIEVRPSRVFAWVAEGMTTGGGTRFTF